MVLEPVRVACPDCDSALEHAFPPAESSDSAWGDVHDTLVGTDLDCDQCGNSIGVYVFDP